MAVIRYSILALLFCSAAFAAPHPGMGSSAIADEKLGYFMGRLGFSIQFQDTSFFLSSANDEIFRYTRKNSPDAILSIRRELLASKLSLDSYTKKWIKDYTSFGMDLLGTQNFAENGNPGILVDLAHSASQKKVRQVIFLKGQLVTILTCSDKATAFEETLKECNKVFRTFNWLQTAL